MARSEPGSQAAARAEAGQSSKSAKLEFSVADALAEWDDDRLVRLLRSRPDLAQPAPGDLAQLSARAASGPSVQACVSHLDLGCCHLIEALCLLEQPTTTDRLADLLGSSVDAHQLEGPLARLEERALVFRQGDQVRLLPVLAQVRYPAGLGPPAEAVLKSQPVATLLNLGERLGVDLQACQAQPNSGRPVKGRVPQARAPKARISKGEALAGIIRAFSDSSLVERRLHEAPPEAADLARRLAVGPPVEYSPYGNYHLSDRTSLGWLANRGLVVPLSWDTLVMPREVALGLRGGRPFAEPALAPPELAVSVVETEAVERAAAEQALRLVGDVAAILDEWGDTPPKLLKAGGIGVREVRRAARATGRSEVEAARLIELAAVAGLVASCSMSMPDAQPDGRAGRPGGARARAGRPGDSQVPDVALPRPAYDEWLTLSVADRWSALVGAWLDADLHLSLAGAIGVDDKPIPALLERFEPEAVPRRLVVLHTLAQVEEGHSGESSSLRQRAWWDAPGQWGGGPATPDRLIGWVREEAELLGLCALGSLSGPGRLVTAGQLPDAADAVARWAPAVTSQVLLQADLTAMATGELAAPVRQELALLADLESSGGATVCRFSEGSLRRAFDAGRSAQDVMAFLEAHATKGVPQPLAYLVADLARRHGRVRVGWATCYLRSADPSLLAEVLRARRTSRLGLRQLAPTVLVSDADPATVTETLRAAGYLPAQEQSDGSLLLVRSEPLRTPGSPAGESLAEHQVPMPSVDSVPSLDSVPAPDLAAMVATLRQAPRPAPGSPAAHNRTSSSAPTSIPDDEMDDGEIDDEYDQEAMDHFRAMLARAGLLGTPDDETVSSGSDRRRDGTDVQRPTEIARGPHAVADLLDQAGDKEWLVRMAYINSTGQLSQVTAAPLMVESHDVTVACLPRWDNVTVPLDRMVWARTLTPAEEERVL